MRRKAIGVVVLGLLLGACTGFGTTVVRVHALPAERHLVTMDANSRAILVQKVDNRVVMCAEPSPDVGANLERNLKATMDLKIPVTGGTVGAGGGLDEASKLNLVKLIERSQALQTLRDILYRACEARMNGFVGAEGYISVMNHALVSTTALLGADLIAGKNDEQTKQILNFIQLMTAQP